MTRTEPLSEELTRMQDGAVCPYCGHNHDTSDLCDRNAMSEDEKTIGCNKCGKDFKVTGSVSWYFSTRTMEAK